MTAADARRARARGRPARDRARDLARSRTRTAAGAELVRAIFSRTGRAYLIGVTGPPGAGKSTLVDRLTADIRARGRRRSACIAVDPTSPFTGGAVLGDRLRMQAHAADDGVFIRSMATRGHLGGLARATGDAALVLDAAGKDVVIIETVGVGQDEVDIVRTADVSIVTLVPGTGDDVQALKAGIMEIADIFVVNKADREGADRLVVGGRSEPVAADVRRRRVAAADPEDRGDERRGRRRAGARRSSSSARTRRRRRRPRAGAARSEYRLRELVSQRFMDASRARRARSRASSTRWSTASPRASSIRTRAAAERPAAAPQPGSRSPRCSDVHAVPNR